MIVEIESDEQILSTRGVMRQLRPHISPDDYLPTVRRMMDGDGYRLVAVVHQGQVCAVAGCRLVEKLSWGKILYVDDLVTGEDFRSGGFGKRLLDWLKQRARTEGCAELHLDSGVQRQQAHRFYFREGMAVTAFHFAFPL